MINKIRKDGKAIKDRKESGRNVLYLLECGGEITAGELREGKIEICCHECKMWSSVGFYGGSNGLLKRKYYCQSCTKSGNKNPFYNKKHTDKTKKLIGDQAAVRCVGEGNPFYGKSHNKKTKDSIAKSLKGRFGGDKNPFYGKQHSEKTRNILREKSKKWLIDHPEQLKKMIRCSLEKQSKGFKSGIEKIVDKELANRGVKYRYNKILHRKYQYDFIIEDNILLEVHGNYWHANPEIYGSKGKPLNERQKYKVARDIVKKDFAIEYGYEIYYIWESEVLSGIFDVIDEIERKL